MTGISEILVLILLICALLIVPRMMKPAPKARPVQKRRGLGPGIRAGIVVSFLVPVVAALVYRPWTGQVLAFLVTGLLPVALAWGIFWILSARKS